MSLKRSSLTGANVYLAATVSVGFSVVLYGLVTWKSSELQQFVILLVLGLFSGQMKVRMPGIFGTMSVSYVLILMAIANFSLGEVLVIAVGATAVQVLWRPKTRPKKYKLLFNLAAIANSAAAAHLCWITLFTEQKLPYTVALFAAACVYFIANTLTVAVIIGLTERKAFLGVWHETYFWYFPSYLLGAAVAAIADHLRNIVGPVFWLLAIPTIYFTYRTFRLYVGRLEDAQAIAELQSKTIQALELAKQQAEEASRMKNQFLANISHELRTPMTGVIGMTDLALETELTEEQRSYLDDARASAVSLLQIINDLLDLTRMESGRLRIEPKAFDPAAAVAEAVESVRVLAQQKDLALQCDLASDLPGRMVADPGRLRQVLVNLIGNSIKFTERGSIRVEARREPGGILLRFSVADTGVGIPKAQHERIFEPFVQVDGSDTRRHGGTGLGLAISSQLVRALGGQIWVESEPGHGSTFHFTIPIVEAPPDSRPEEVAPVSSFVRRR